LSKVVLSGPTVAGLPALCTVFTLCHYKNVYYLVTGQCEGSLSSPNHNGSFGPLVQGHTGVLHHCWELHGSPLYQIKTEFRDWEAVLFTERCKASSPKTARQTEAMSRVRVCMVSSVPHRANV
jgi:hypothetical protein